VRLEAVKGLVALTLAGQEEGGGGDERVLKALRACVEDPDTQVRAAALNGPSSCVDVCVRQLCKRVCMRVQAYACMCLCV